MNRWRLGKEEETHTGGVCSALTSLPHTLLFSTPGVQTQTKHTSSPARLFLPGEWEAKNDLWLEGFMAVLRKGTCVSADPGVITLFISWAQTEQHCNPETDGARPSGETEAYRGSATCSKSLSDSIARAELRAGKIYYGKFQK